VVITIIGMLMSLILPAVNQARETASRLDCATRENQICLAADMFNTESRGLPGYIMSSGKNNSGTAGNYRTAWPVMLAPHLGRTDIWKSWLTGGAASPAATIYWKQMVCPSNPPASETAPYLAYVLNSGRPDNGNVPPDLAANGVAFNLFDTLNNQAAQVRVSKENLESSKGSSYTLLLSENTIPGLTWSPGGPISSALVGSNCELMCGFNWQMTTTPNIAQVINGDKNNKNPPAAGCVATDYARPASNHIGGVNVGFCDGHTQFIQQAIDYKVYETLMASDPSKPDAATYIGNYILNNADF